MSKRTILVMFLAAALVGACGGDGTDAVGTPAPTSVGAPTTGRPSSPPTTGTGSLPPATSVSTTSLSGPALNDSSTLDLRGLGPVRVGMTPIEATTAAGIPVSASGPPECSYATVAGGPEGVDFMVVDGRIARVDVQQDSLVKTRSGAGVGDTEAQVQARYSNRLQVSGHKYVPEGHYLTLVPTDAADTGFRVVFETDGSKVTRFRSGRVPEVGYIEGCS